MKLVVEIVYAPTSGVGVAVQERNRPLLVSQRACPNLRVTVVRDAEAPIASEGHTAGLVVVTHTRAVAMHQTERGGPIDGFAQPAGESGAVAIGGEVA